MTHPAGPLPYMFTAHGVHPGAIVLVDIDRSERFVERQVEAFACGLALRQAMGVYRLEDYARGFASSEFSCDRAAFVATLSDGREARHLATRPFHDRRDIRQINARFANFYLPGGVACRKSVLDLSRLIGADEFGFALVAVAAPEVGPETDVAELAGHLRRIIRRIAFATNSRPARPQPATIIIVAGGSDAGRLASEMRDDFASRMFRLWGRHDARLGHAWAVEPILPPDGAASRVAPEVKEAGAAMLEGAGIEARKVVPMEAKRKPRRPSLKPVEGSGGKPGGDAA